MKEYLLFGILLLSFTVNKSLAQADSIYGSIKGLNFDHYAALPVDSFLNVIPQSYTYMKIIGSTKNDRARGLSIYYPNGMSVWIQPLHCIFMNRTDPNRIWNLNLFKKEIAHYILVIAPQASLWGQE